MVWDDWPPSSSPLLTEYSSRDDPSWTLSGRRAEVRGTGQAGVGEIRVRPWSIVREVRLEVNGQRPSTVSLKVAPDEIVRVLEAGEVQLTERITTALDHPLVFWSIVADAPVPLCLRWITDLTDASSADAPLVPLIAEDQPHLESRIRVGREEDLPRFLVQPEAGIAGVTGPVGHSLGFEVRSDRILRVVLAAGADDAELDRAVNALSRRKLRAFRQDRILHTRRLEDRLVSLVSPDPALDRAFGWAKVELDARLEARPHRGRWVAQEAVRVARAALAMGDRDVARDVLRSLGSAEPENGERRRLPLLVESYIRWTGEMLPDAVAGPASVTEPATFELTGPYTDPAGLILGIVEGLWGIRPDAIRGEVRIVPRLPPAWSEMALQRVRIGATMLDLRIRRRPERIVVVVRRSAGPPLRLQIGLADRTGRGPVTLDEVELGGREVWFTIEESHEVAFYDE